MNVVAGSNILFSALLSGKSVYLDIFRYIDVYAPDFIFREIFKYEETVIAKTHLKDEALEGGAYEIIRKWLTNLSNDLFDRISRMNQRRKAVFGARESRPLKTDRILTENTCVPRLREDGCV